METLIKMHARSQNVQFLEQVDLYFDDKFLPIEISEEKFSYDFFDFLPTKELKSYQMITNEWIEEKR